MLVSHHHFFDMEIKMKKIYQIASIGLATALVSGCGSDGTVSTGGAGMDASNCVTRTIKTVYANDCDFDVNAIILEAGATAFEIHANRAVTKKASGNSFGACRAPSQPVLNGDASSFTCS